MEVGNALHRSSKATVLYKYSTCIKQVMYSKLRCNMELQTSEEGARCESIIEDMYVGEKKKGGGGE